MSLAEELLADLEEDGYDESEPMIVHEEALQDLPNTSLIPKQTGTFKKMICNNTTHYLIKFVL